MRWLLIAMRNVLRDGKRVFSTILIIAVGLTALLIGGGFMLSAYDSLQEIAMRTKGHVIVLADGAKPVGGSHQQLVLSNWQDIQDELWLDEQVIRVLPRAHFEGMISNGAFSAAFAGTGVDPSEEFRVYGPFLNIPKGELLTPWLSANDMPEVMLGDQLAATLNADIGDTLTLHTLRADGQPAQLQVRLSGLFHTGTPELDDHTLTVSLDSVQVLLNNDNISALSVYLGQGADISAFKQKLAQQLNGLEIQSWDQQADTYQGVKALYNRIFSVMGVIILVVVFLAISNTVALAIYQRRDEIATLGALGTTPLRICANFIIEALLVGLIAVVVGMALGYGIASAINLANLWMPPPPGRTEGYPLYIYISLPHYLAIAATLMIITTLAALLSAHRATRVNIAQALS